VGSCSAGPSRDSPDVPETGLGGADDYLPGRAVVRGMTEDGADEHGESPDRDDAEGETESTTRDDSPADVAERANVAERADTAARGAERAGQAAESLREQAEAVRDSLARFETSGDPPEDTDLESVRDRLDHWETSAEGDDPESEGSGAGAESDESDATEE
jgi:hypothetical protein